MQIYDVFIAVAVVVAKDQNGKQIITLSPPYSTRLMSNLLTTQENTSYLVAHSSC